MAVIASRASDAFLNCTKAKPRDLPSASGKCTLGSPHDLKKAEKAKPDDEVKPAEEPAPKKANKKKGNQDDLQRRLPPDR